MLTVVAKGNTLSGTQHAIRFVNEFLKTVASRRMRLPHSFCPTPASHEKLSSGMSVGLEKPGKKRSLKVGARNPEPAPPWIRVPVSVIGPKAFVPCTSAVSQRYSTPKVLVDHVPTWKWFSHSTSRRSTLNSPGKLHGGPSVLGGHANGSGGSMKFNRFQ